MARAFDYFSVDGGRDSEVEEISEMADWDDDTERDEPNEEE